MIQIRLAGISNIVGDPNGIRRGQLQSIAHLGNQISALVLKFGSNIHEFPEPINPSRFAPKAVIHREVLSVLQTEWMRS